MKMYEQQQHGETTATAILYRALYMFSSVCRRRELLSSFFDAQCFIFVVVSPSVSLLSMLGIKKNRSNVYKKERNEKTLTKYKR